MPSGTLSIVSLGPNARAAAEAALDIIFVHGLTGDQGTWGADEQFWPAWLAQDYADCDVYTAEYASTKWSTFRSGPGASIQDLATVLIEAMLNRARPAPRLMLVTHSLGGLVAKQAIRKCCDSSNGELRGLAATVSAVAFLSTPHQGAQLAKTCDLILRNTKSRLAQQLAYGNDELIDLHEFFRNWAARAEIAVRAFYETERTWGVHVVDKVTANPNVPGNDPVAVQSDHIGIAKPDDRSAPVYRSISRMIDQLLAQPPRAPPSAPSPRLQARTPPLPPASPAGESPSPESQPRSQAASFSPDPSGLDLVPLRDDVSTDPQQLSRLSEHTLRCMHLSVEGISGSGKTTLVAQWVRQQATGGRWSHVLWHEGSPGDLLDHVIASAPTLSIDPAWSQRAKARALLTYLKRSNALLVIDDVQFADVEDVGILIEEVAGQTGSCNLITISQTRVGSHRQASLVNRFVPANLTHDQVVEFTSSTLSRELSAADARRLHQITDGLPFAVALFCALSREFGYPTEQLLSGSAALKDRLEDWCSAATSRLGTEDRRLLLGLGVVDGPLEFGLVQAVGETVNAESYPRSFEAIVGSHLLRRHAETTWIMHSILAEHCRRTIHPVQRRNVLVAIAEAHKTHGKLAASANEQFSHISSACRYLLLAERYVEAEKILHGLIPRAKRLGQFNPLRALLSAYAEAIHPAPLPKWLGYHYVHSLFVLGHLEQAASYLAFFLHASTIRDANLRLSCQRLLADILLAQGRPSEAWSAIEIGDQVRCEPDINGVTLAQFLGSKTQVLLASGRTKEAEAAVNDVLKIPTRPQNRLHWGVVNMHLSQLRGAQGDHSAALELAERARADFGAARDQRGFLWAEAHVGLGEICNGEEGAGVTRIVEAVRKLSQFELPPHNFLHIARIALQHCTDAQSAEVLQNYLAPRSALPIRRLGA
jgi:pimeloyl-ACP methyl ester carboxylesterase